MITGHSDVGIRFCNYCKHEKPWVWTGKKLKDGSRIYVDASNARWAGKRCPDCEKQRVQAAVKCDSFERELILKQLEERGFAVVSKTLPLKVSREGRTYTLNIKRAFTMDGRIIVEGLPENNLEEGRDLVVLLFESVRICSPDQIRVGAPGIQFYGEATANPTDTSPETTDRTAAVFSKKPNELGLTQ